MTMPELPQCLVEDEILSRVPATSLKRLKSTCKQWNRLFNDKSFARNHSDKAAKQFLALLLTKEFRISSLSIDFHGIPYAELNGELSLRDSRAASDSAQLNISQVFHCDGFLLCTIPGKTKIVIWNPYTGQTKWIKARKPFNLGDTFTLGSYNNSSHNTSYKLLRHEGLVEYYELQKFEICDINSNQWRILDVHVDLKLLYTHSRVSLKGKTYWFACDEKERHLYLNLNLDYPLFLVSFDYTREKFERVCLPDHIHLVFNEDVSLSAVREEKLSVLLRDTKKLHVEIWVSSKIGEGKVVSWSKILVADYPRIDIIVYTSFLVNEEKKLAVCCERRMQIKDMRKYYDLVYIVEEDNQFKLVDFAAATTRSCGSLLFNYVPSLVQLEAKETEVTK